MGYLLTALSGLSFFKKREDDDLVDRLHYFLTTNLLICLAVLVSWKQFGGKPIECMCPTEFPFGWEQYAESYCFAQDTYFVPLNQENPPDLSERNDAKISYYQWTPFFLLIQSICFSLPSLFWHIFSGSSGLKVQTLVKQAKDPENIKPEVRANTVKVVTVHIEKALRFQRRLLRKKIVPHRIFRCLNIAYSGYYVTVFYLISKFLALINVVAQFFMMNRFLMTDDYSYYGFGALRDIFNGTTWEVSGLFPRVTLCDLQIRMLAQVPRYTVQCTLSINLFNEKIFIFLWFWYCLMAVLTFSSMFYWFILLVIPQPAKWFVIRHLELSDSQFDPKTEGKAVMKFVSRYLKSDGVFVIRMITMHTGVIMGTDVVAALWARYYGIELERQRSNESDNDKRPSEMDVEGENKLNTLRLRPRRSVGGIKGSSEAEDLTQVLVGFDHTESLCEVDGGGGRRPKAKKSAPSAHSEDDADLSDIESATNKVKFALQ